MTPKRKKSASATEWRTSLFPRRGTMPKYPKVCSSAADKINVAIGEEMGEEALPALSKMVEVMGLIPKMGIEKAMEATGSAMFKLSTTSTSTSNDIVEFAKRLTGVARTAGITTDQLLALGSASSSMMLMPEVASTAPVISWANISVSRS